MTHLGDGACLEMTYSGVDTRPSIIKHHFLGSTIVTRPRRIVYRYRLLTVQVHIPLTSAYSKGELWGAFWTRLWADIKVNWLTN